MAADPTDLSDLGFIPAPPAGALGKSADPGDLSDLGFVPSTTAPQSSGPQTTNSQTAMAPIPQSAVRAGLDSVPRTMISTAGTVGGAALGGLTSPFTGLAGPMAGAAGGNYAAQQLNKLLGLQTKTDVGDVVASAITGAVPAGPIEGSLLKNLGIQGTKAAAANVAATTAQTLIDEGKMPTFNQIMLSAGGGYLSAGATKLAGKPPTGAGPNATEAQTLAESRNAGYVVPLHATNPNAVTNALGSIGGKAATDQAAAKANQRITNRLAATSIGLNPNQPITEAGIQRVRDAAYTPYMQVRGMAENAQQQLATIKAQMVTGTAQDDIMNQTKAFNAATKDLQTVASADVDGLREARAASKVNWKAYQASGGTNLDAQKAAKSFASQADDMEQQINAAAVAAGRPELLGQLQDARTLIAKTHVVEGALNEANGEISAPYIGSAYKNDVPLTGPLATIGKFQQSFGQYAREGSKVPNPAVSKLGSVLGGTAGALVGSEHGSIMGIAASMAPGMASDAARAVSNASMLQKGMLSGLSRPTYMSDPTFLTQLLKSGALSGSRQSAILLPQLLPGGAQQ